MSAPPPEVLAAYDVSALHRLAGGQERTWTDGRVVLRPVGLLAEHEWICKVYDGWQHDASVRVPSPLRAPDGRWSRAGWAAHTWVPGRDATMIAEPGVIRNAGEAFHAAVAALARPAFLDERDDDWTYGDLVAWEGAPPVGEPPTLALIGRGLAALGPVSVPSQVVHGDLGGNVVLAEGLPPAVIDWPPYFRPAGWALAVAAVDAICWEGVPLSLLDEWVDLPDWGQLCLRAVVYRLATRGRHEWRGGRSPLTPQEYAAARSPSLDAVLARL